MHKSPAAENIKNERMIQPPSVFEKTELKATEKIERILLLAKKQAVSPRASSEGKADPLDSDHVAYPASSDLFDEETRKAH